MRSKLTCMHKSKHCQYYKLSKYHALGLAHSFVNNFAAHMAGKKVLSTKPGVRHDYDCLKERKRVKLSR